MNFLDDTERARLRIQHKHERDGRVRDRIKAAVVPGKANEQQQKEWIAEYEKLRATLSPDEIICFIDGVHPTHNVQPAYEWIKK